MLNSQINFITEVPNGNMIRVTEHVNVIAARMKVARVNDDPTIEVTAAGNKMMIIPVHLIGPVTSLRSRNDEYDN